MVATLVRLKLRILGHTLRREVWRVVVAVLGTIWALLLVPSIVGGMVWLSGQPITASQDVLVIAGALLVLGWAVVPVLIPGMDDSLDISRFATTGVPARRLAPGLVVAGLVSVPALFTGLLCLAPLIVWGAHGRAPLLVAAVAAPIAVVTCLLAARLSTLVAARVLGSRRARETSAGLGLVAVALVVPLVITIGRLGLEETLERIPAVAQVLGWTPLALVWAAPSAMAVGDTTGAVLRLTIAVATVVVGTWAWGALMQRSLHRPPSRAGQARRRADGVLPAGNTARHPGLVAARAITTRGLRYWTADPRYLGSLLGAVVAPVVIVLLAATVVDAPAAVALSMGALIAGTLGWGRHNDIAFDGSAFWLHVAAHVPGWADRLGRTMATLVWAAPLVIVVAVAGAGVGGRWDLAPAAVGMGIGVLCAGLGVSAVASAVFPYPVAEAGGNPYSAQMGAVGASLVAQLVSSMTTLIACVPVSIAYAAALWWRPSVAGVTLAIGLLVGAVTLAGGIVLGGRLYDARAPRLLARLA